jgi:hypothetical protein
MNTPLHRFGLHAATSVASRNDQRHQYARASRDQEILVKWKFYIVSSILPTKAALFVHFSSRDQLHEEFVLMVEEKITATFFK